MTAKYSKIDAHEAISALVAILQDMFTHGDESDKRDALDAAVINFRLLNSMIIPDMIGDIEMTEEEITAVFARVGLLADAGVAQRDPSGETAARRSSAIRMIHEMSDPDKGAG